MIQWRETWLLNSDPVDALVVGHFCGSKNGCFNMG